jgi:hypothetical protein
MHLFYKNTSSNDLHWIENDGTTWSHDMPLMVHPSPGKIPHVPQVSGTPAAAQTGTNGLFLFYKATSSNDIMVIRSDNSWTEDVPLRSPNIRQPVSDHNPAAAMYGTNLFLVWKGENSNDLWVAQMDQQLNWSWGLPISVLTNGRIAPKSNISPNVIAFNNKLYIIYKGESSNDLYLTIFDSTAGWSGDVKISSQPGGIFPESSDRPSLVIFNNLLYMIYKGPNNTDLNYAVFDGNAWRGNAKISEQAGGIHPESDLNPGLLWLDNRMWLAYKSPNNTNLNYAYFDGTTWSGNSQIRVQPGGQIPQSGFSPLFVADP